MASVNKIKVGNTTYDIENSGYSVSDVYSTTEKEVGTWIDGKKVFQKTFSTTMASAVNTLKEVSIGATVATCVEIKALLNINGIYQPLAIGSNDGFNAFAKVNVATNTSTVYTKNTIGLRTSVSGWVDLPVYVTIKYTKV